MDLINPPPRDSLTFTQKVGRTVLVTVTIVTLCVILALVGALGMFAWQRSREFFEGAPDVRNALSILAASLIVNAACISALLQIKKLDRKLMASHDTGFSLPPRGPVGPTRP
jgi:uncharacterized membrane protein YidH (DUF202 family)